MGVEGCIQPLFKKVLCIAVWLYTCVSVSAPVCLRVCMSVCVYAHTCMPLSHAQYDSLCECMLVDQSVHDTASVGIGLLMCVGTGQCK